MEKTGKKERKIGRPVGGFKQVLRGTDRPEGKRRKTADLPGRVFDGSNDEHVPIFWIELPRWNWGERVDIPDWAKGYKAQD